jgi:tetratricopeptide (TPR) repeat protein
MREAVMKSVGSIVDQLEELVNEVLGLGDSLARTAEDLRMAKSFHADGVVRELAEARQALLGVSGQLAEMERFLSPSGEPGVAAGNQSRESSESPAPSPAVSLRPVGPDEGVPATAPAGGSLGRKWEEADARLSGLSELIQRSLRAQSASDAAMNLGNLALEYHRQKKFDEAESLYRHALAFREKFFGPHHATVATGLNNLAILLRDQGKYEEADALFRRSLWITEKSLGPDHPKVARRLSNLATLALLQGRYSEAEFFFRRILAIGEKHGQKALPEVRASLRKYVEALKRAGRTAESAEITSRMQGLLAGGTGGGLTSEIESF